MRPNLLRSRRQGPARPNLRKLYQTPTGRFRQAKVEDPLRDLPHSDVHHFKANALRSPESPWKASLVGKKKKRSAASHNALPCEQHRERADTSREHAQHWALTAHHGVAHLITQLHDCSSLCKLLPPSKGSTSHIRVVLSNRPYPSSSLFHF